MLVVATLSTQVEDRLGRDGLLTIIAVGWVICLVWMVIDYRRGKPVFNWQKRHG